MVTVKIFKKIHKKYEITLKTFDEYIKNFQVILNFKHKVIIFI